MISEKSLFDRINSDSASYSLHFDYANLHYSILNSLQNMLNVRKGSLVSRDDNGIPDFSEFVSQFPDAINKLKLAIRDFLHTFEPRIQSVQITHEPDTDKPLELKFSIVTKVFVDDDIQNLSFETVLTSSGQAIVRG
ncbi:type VI secretion system baseplate subunit TssE [sulfur-oxidizing endosymbiont of Gigantopelta aegis]|uniref:type VI secretion system baseplate subunit TssE n=1 Tax=sulfur-oxidizing endosymbiont of Gigantopelta aegis TaxID=2794934 RepID=UPI0018DE3AA8|nr:type VI secretion system baseplate subunit TssE [sulfur-oxidizing endosymbiont of Gigantopelta aegis]